MERRRTFLVDHPEHLGEARRDGGAYTPALTHADLDAAVQRFAQQGVQDGALALKDGVDLGNPDDNSTVPLVGTKPCAPTSLVITPHGEAELIYADISWTAGTCLNNGARYQVTLTRTDDALEARFPITRTVKTLNARFENLEAVTGYAVTVIAISNTNIHSDPLTGSFTSSADTTIPPTVTGLVVTAGLRTIVARWTDSTAKDVINGNGTYKIDLATNSGFTTGVKTQRSSGSVTVFSDLSPAVAYYVRVYAIDKSGNVSAAPSSTVSATTGQAATADIQTGAVTADLVAAGAIYTGALQADSVTAAKLSAITLEVGKYIESTTYSAGTAGWRINASGNAEFNNVIVRGTVISNSFQTVSSGARVRMGSALTAADEIQFLGSSGGVGSIRNGQFVYGYANSMRLSAGGIIDISDGGGIGNQVTITPTLVVTGDTIVQGGFSTYATGSIGSTLDVTGALTVNGHSFLGHSTTGSAANAVLNSFTGELTRSTSSQRFKRDITPVFYDHSPSVLLDVQAKTWLSRLTEDDLGGSDDPTQRFIGLIAEDLAAADPILATYDSEGVVEGINWNAVTAFLLEEVKRLRFDLDNLQET